MGSSKEELIREIEAARKLRDEWIESGKPYAEIYEQSVALDALIEQYVMSGF